MFDDLPRPLRCSGSDPHETSIRGGAFRCSGCAGPSALARAGTRIERINGRFARRHPHRGTGRTCHRPMVPGNAVISSDRNRPSTPCRGRRSIPPWRDACSCTPCCAQHIERHLVAPSSAKLQDKFLEVLHLTRLPVKGRGYTPYGCASGYTARRPHFERDLLPSPISVPGMVSNGLRVTPPIASFIGDSPV